MDFNSVIWRKVKEGLRIHVLKENSFKHSIKKLQELDKEDVNIDLASVCEWSRQNEIVYK